MTHQPQIHSARLSTAVGLLAGAVLDAMLGDPADARHPTAWFGRWAGWLENRLYTDSQAAGICYTAVALAPMVGLGIGLEYVTRRHRIAHGLATAVVTWAVLGAHSLAHEGETMATLLDAGDLAGARAQLPHLCGRLADELPAAELARASVESLAENTADSAVASLMWGGLAGIPGLLLHRAANTLDAMVGHHNDRYEHFGWASARLDDALDYLPARCTGVLGALAAPVVGGHPLATARVVARDAGNHPSPNGGWCESAWAGALGVQLGGRNNYPGDRVEQRGLLGVGGRAPDSRAVRGAARLVQTVSSAAAVLCAAACWWRGRRQQ